MNEQRPRKISKKKLQVIIAGLFFLVNIIIWSVVFRADNNGYLTVAFLDVGQGDAIFIEAPNGNQLLIDGGAGRGVLRELGSVMPFYDHSIDAVLATHPDQDHTGGLPAVLERMDVSTVITTENTSDTNTYRAFESAVKMEGSQRVLARTGGKIILDKDIALEILFPDRNTDGWESNTASIVARLSYGDESFLFTGDSPMAIEKYLVDIYGNNLKTTVLKLGHHGSKTSSSLEFLSFVDPDYAVISAGKDNKYGHPHKEVVTLLDQLGITKLSTIESGTVIFKTNGENLQLKK